MSNPSAICKVNGQTLAVSGTTGLNVTAGSTVTISLSSTAGVESWSISCTDSDGYNPGSAPATINSGLSVNLTNFTATFTAPSMYQTNLGAAMQFTSTVNAGKYNANTVTFGVFVLHANGGRFFFGSESYESNATVGCAYDLNVLSAQGQGSATTMNGDVTGTVSNNVVSKISGTSPIVITPSTLEWAVSVSNPAIGQSSTSGATGQNLQILPQQATATPSSGGSLQVYLQTPKGAGSEAFLQTYRGSLLSSSLGALPGSGGASSALYLGQNTPSSSNYALAGNNGSGGSTTLNAPSLGTLYLAIGGVSLTQLSTTALYPSVDLSLSLGSSANRWINSSIAYDYHDGATVTTTNATVTTIYTEPAEAASTTYDYVMTVVGQNPSNGDLYRADFAFNYQRIGSAAPTVAGTSPVAMNVRTTGAGNTYGGVTFVVSGDSLVVQVAGAASTTVHWTIDFHRVTSA